MKMNSQPPPESTVPKPPGLTDAEWEQVLLAARSSWLSYIFRATWQTYGCLILACGILINAIAQSHGAIAAAFHTALCRELAVPLLGAFLFIRVLCGSIDWCGKRDLARQLRLIPQGH